MNRKQKEQAVVELTHEFGAAEAVYAVDYRGLTVAQISELRARLLQNETTLKVVKNSVTKLAADQADVSTISEHLSGPTALAFVRGDAAASAKILNGFVKESNEILELKGGLLNGTPLTSEEVISIAKLPSREVLIQQLVSMIASPIAGTARTLNAILAAVPIQLQKIADEGLIGGGAGTPADATAASAPTEAPASADAPTPEAEAAPAADAEADAAPADAAADTDSTEE